MMIWWRLEAGKLGFGGGQGGATNSLSEERVHKLGFLVGFEREEKKKDECKGMSFYID